MGAGAEKGDFSWMDMEMEKKRGMEGEGGGGRSVDGWMDG